MSNTQILLEPGDVGRVLHVSTQRVVQLADAGTLPLAARTVRGLRLFTRADVDRLAEVRLARQGQR